MFWKFMRNFLSFKDLLRSVGFKWSKSRLCRSHISPHEKRNSHLFRYFPVLPCLPEEQTKPLAWFHLGHVWIMPFIQGSKKDPNVVTNNHRCFLKSIDFPCLGEVLLQACENMLPPSCNTFLKLSLSWVSFPRLLCWLSCLFFNPIEICLAAMPCRLREPRVQTQR